MIKSGESVDKNSGSFQMEQTASHRFVLNLNSYWGEDEDMKIGVYLYGVRSSPGCGREWKLV